MFLLKVLVSIEARDAGPPVGHHRESKYARRTHLFNSLRYGLSRAPSPPFPETSAVAGVSATSALGVAEPALEAFAEASALALFFFADLNSTWAAGLETMVVDMVGNDRFLQSWLETDGTQELGVIGGSLEQKFS